MLLHAGIMELLQWGSYQVIDDCSSSVNRMLTLASYAHVCFNPLMINVYFFVRPHDMRTRRELVHFILALSAAGGVLLLLRLPGSPAGALGNLLHPAIPDVPPTAAAGSACGATEHMCGRRTCSIQGAYHLAWSIQLLPATYYLPTAQLHFFLMFVPGLIAGSRQVRVLALMLLATAPSVMWLLSKDGGPVDTYWFEAGSIW